MVDQLSYIEIQTVQLFLGTQPDEYIAMVIEKPVELVRAAIDQLTDGGTIRKSFKHLQMQKQLKVVNAKNFKEQDKKEAIKRRIAMQSEAAQKRAKDNQPKFETKTIDYSQMILVRIDAKTFIHVKPGTDIEKAKQTFLQNHKSYTAPAPERPWQKFKPDK
jgi:hypothetical protein